MEQYTEYALIVSILLLAAFLAAVIFFLIAQQKVLQLIEPQHRQMKPGEVWLQLIPLYGWVWQFIVVTRISYSIQAQLIAQDNDTIIGPTANPVDRPTYKSGIAYCIFTIVSTCTSFLPGLDLFDFFLSVGMIITWILYWVELEKFKRALKLKLTSGIAA